MSMWHERWAVKKTTWDLNGPHPLTKSLFQNCASLSPEKAKGRWLIPGCGRAHDGPYLLELGAKSVDGRDLVPQAIDEAGRLYGSVANLRLSSGDITQVSYDDVCAFDCIFDRAMLCALQGQARDNYVNACAQYLKPGGLFASLAFASTSQPEVGPPFQITRSEIEVLFGGNWRIECLEERFDGPCDQKILSEWLLIAQKL
jgi:SAM-dependent methyltransferase